MLNQINPFQSKKKSRKLPNKSLLLKLSKDAVPKHEGPWKVILDSVGPAYFDGRAIELISNASKLLNDPDTLTDLNKYLDYDDLVTQAMQMLLMARAVRGSYLAKEQQSKVINLTSDGLELGTEPFGRTQVVGKSIEVSNPHQVPPRHCTVCFFNPLSEYQRSKGDTICSGCKVKGDYESAKTKGETGGKDPVSSDQGTKDA